MSKILKTIKAKVLDIGLNFLSLDEKLAYVIFETKSSHVNPITILATSKSTIHKLKRKMSNPQPIGALINGHINGIPVSILRAGIGNPHVAMVMEALKRSACSVVIRIDFCGGLKSIESDVDIADVIIPEEVMLTDGTSHSYLQVYSDTIEKYLISSHSKKNGKNSVEMLEYPFYKEKYWGVSSSPELSKLVWDSVRAHQYDFNVKPGKLWSIDALFCENEQAVTTWKTYGANSVDMESSMVYLLGKLFGIHAISILGISDLPDTNDWNFQKTNKIHPKYGFILDNAINVLVDVLPEIANKVLAK